MKTAKTGVKRIANKDKTECKYGHPFTPENTYYVELTAPSNGKRYRVRQCTACHARMEKNRYRRQQMAKPCGDCGEVGREKKTLWVARNKTLHLCHDEEKSCYNYMKVNLENAKR